MKYFRYKFNKICEVSACYKILMKENFKNLNKWRDIPFLWIWRLNKSCSSVSTGNWLQDHPKIPKSEDAQVPWCRTIHTAGALHSQISNHGSKILFSNLRRLNPHMKNLRI